MEKIRVMTVFGTRPEAVKMAPLVKALESEPLVESIVCVTAQHREMLDQVLNVFAVEPDDDLDIMEPQQTLGTITRKALEGIEQVIAKRRPHIVLVHGDTTTTFAAALAAFYQQVAIGHVEAGLRTYDKYSPFPEEMNRQLADVLSDLFFAPTDLAAEQLRREGKPDEAIYVTGNTAIDAMKTTVYSTYRHPILEQLPPHSQLVYMTSHRRENLGEPLRNICSAVLRLVESHTDVQLIYPVHLNPSVRDTVFTMLGGHPRIHLIDPLGIVDNHNFMARAKLILTDSGGIQEEAPSLGIPVLVLRDTTERPEGIEAGTLKLVGTNEKEIYETASRLLTDQEFYKDMAGRKNPYGDGKASERIVEAILHYFGHRDRPKAFVYNENHEQA
ncbi:non-hydrolyzing UDP-N-acetylglucosamine 2-epimerase [Alicyclobacillus tolerans]|uniref:UDP-N-acetylglucosamine 2-epimerase (non-hydrolyzing) n=2 Tax=Alicyclobacillus tolerans TaxID=90970 RepID=A0A1M6TAD4_9BACL|nr:MULTISPECIES: UDP-N-acetylglucosamine 2-epimerase (non-hydrolyzing) [Alicyclobacillus]MDP9727767.1 UDP-N-acetylglucosamine 2-epimerase (non-hydrolyzing) [Alicyclobacillus tengchongensis]SHK54012.1 UDP-N-Acetylglucosamine 2-epimerase [Alicyclobacillus montanus]